MQFANINHCRPPRQSCVLKRIRLVIKSAFFTVPSAEEPSVKRAWRPLVWCLDRDSL